MHLVYIDDSGDPPAFGIFSALAIPEESWQFAFAAIKNFRHAIRRSDGIDIHKELHAWKFVSGRGHIADRIVTKSRRCALVGDALRVVASIPGACLFNAAFHASKEDFAFERLLNRIQKNMEVKNARALLFSDKGKEEKYTMIRRKMGVHNPIPSRYGVWRGGTARKNIVIDRIIEDPVFKDSKHSYIIQMVDFCAYALLRRERPLPSKSKYGLHQMFDLLQPILCREANRSDKDGIIRIP